MLRKRFLTRGTLLAFSASLLSVCTLKAQAPADPPSMKFAVVAVHRNMGEYGAWGVRFTSTGFSAKNAPLRYLIQDAYGIYESYRFAGPAWVDSARYEIEAKVDPEHFSEFQAASDAQHEVMLRGLLADRFGLRVHLEARNLPVYALTVTKGGVKMQPTAQKIPTESGAPICHMASGARMDVWPVVACSMEDLARMLSGTTERRVVDQTGLKDRYDFTLRWDRNAQSMDEAGTSLYTALKEQLGISLEGGKAMLDVIVVDRVEAPSEN